MAKGNVLVIGGGPAGCAAAWEAARTGYRVTLVEDREKLGGLASNLVFNGNVYEYGTHVFHTDKPLLLKQIKDLMGSELIEMERGSRLSIKFWDRYFVYPLQGLDLLKKLPLGMGAQASLSFLKSFLLYDCLFRNRMPRDTEEYLIQKFGKVLYDAFFRDYTEKVWGVPCSGLDAIFGEQRIPRTDILSVFKKVLDCFGLSPLIAPHPLSESVIGNLYYTEKGTGRIFEKIGEEIKGLGGEVLTGTKLKHFVLENNRVRVAILQGADGDFEVEPECVIITIPLPILVQCFGQDIPPDVQQACQNLRYRSLSVIGMLVSKPQVRPAYLTYFKNLTFNRLSEPSNHALKVTPQGHSLLLVETICAYGDQVYRGDEAFSKNVVEDMVHEGLLEEKDIVEMHHYSWQYAYPVYEVGFMKNVSRIHAFLDSIGNIQSTGRHGNFSYVNMHVTMQMGIDSLKHVQKYM